MGGLFDLVARSAFKPDIGLDVSSEEKDILLHYANTTTQSLNIPLANIDSIDEDLPILDFVKATDQIDDCTLTSAGRPYQRDTLARYGFELGIA